MPPKKKRTKINEARRYLSGGGVLREDSDDELGQEDHPWEWLHEDEQDPNSRIIGARMGSFTCHVGDTVLLKAPASNEAWVAMLYEFTEQPVDDEDDRASTRTEKRASMLWFSSDKEIQSKKKRTDSLPNELYITTNFDENALETINGKAQVISHEQFMQQYPSGKVPRHSRDYGKIFICRRGVNPRTATYTEEFDWSQIYNGKQDMDAVIELVESQTIKTRRRRERTSPKPDDFDPADGEHIEDDNPQTPRKRRKLNNTTATPSKAKHLSPHKFTTPTGRKITTKKQLAFTPLGTRILTPAQLNASPYQQARATLHVSAVPHSLPGRELEFDTVYSHLEAAITAGTGACIYISGTPGTGKTATVREVVAALQSAVADESLDDFYFVEINGMKVTDPHQAYSLLWEALKGDRVSPAHALELLDREFTTPSPRRVPCVVLMDELDQLVTRNQGVMYNFFNWPQLRHARLIVLAVANTMDLPERTLSNKISSRLGLVRITFPGYTHTQLMAIIQARLAALTQLPIHPDAIQFAARKVAAVSGDARRALDICRRAVELAEQDSTSSTSNPSTTTLVPATVTIATIKRAIQESTSTPLLTHLRALPLIHKLLLATVLALLRRTGLPETSLAEIHDLARPLALSSAAPSLKKLLAISAATASSFSHTPSSPPPSHTDSLALQPLTPSKRGRRKLHPSGGDAAPLPRIMGLATAVRDLADAGILAVEARHGERVGRVRLAVAEEEVRAALREDVEGVGLGVVG